MRRIVICLLASVSLLCAKGADDFTGKVITQSRATSVAAGQWYTLYNSSSGVFLCDDGSGTLTTSTTPALNLATDHIGNLVMLESAGDGTYYVKTARGNYLGGLTTSTLTTSATAQAAYTISSVDGNAESWSISNNGMYLDGSMKGVTSQGSGTTWTAYEATLNSEDELSASQRMTYQEKLFMSDTPCLARFFCKRNTSKYLTSTESGVACGANLASATDLSQIWVVTSKNDDAYTFRNAETGEFLTDTYCFPGSETTLYLQESPNNSNEQTDYYYNISSKSDFSGRNCLNLGNDGFTLNEWSCGGGDTGSDWAAEIVYEVTLDDVTAHLEESNIYAAELAEGVYYHIVSDAYGVHMTEANGLLECVTEEDSNLAQCWQLIKSGDEWQIKNVLTECYVQKQSTTYSSYYTSSKPVSFYIDSTGEALKHAWFIHNNADGSDGDKVLHCDSGYKVVPWYTSSDGSKWLFLEVELDEDDIAAARSEYADYLELVENLGTIQVSLDNIFADKACTILNESVAALSDEELEANSDYAALPDAIKQMVMKVKNDSWDMPTSNSTVTDSYEKFFRIVDYSPYSNHSLMSGSGYAAQGHTYGKLSGPTGIFLNSGDILYLYVGESPSSDCTLQVEVVTTEGEAGSHQTGLTTDLTAGLNVIRAGEQDVVYIFYQLDDPDKYLADYPDIKIHIEGGTINGYWDATRDMTNQDWANMKDMGLLSKCPVLNMKTEHLVLVMATDVSLKAITTAHQTAGDSMEDVEKLMRIWNIICANEEAYQGLDEFEGRLRNIWNAFSITHSFMYASNYGTYYSESTLSDIMNYYHLTHTEEGNEGGPLWGQSHEMGHNHQGAIKLIGTVESSNNLFSNINLFEQGVSTTRYSSPVLNFDTYLANGISWIDYPIEVTTRMFFQLYLYFHAMGHDTEFLPKLFKELRKDPLSQGSKDNSLKADSDGDGVIDVTGGYKSYGKDDYLHFAKKVCDVAQADLSEFFESYGMFVPIADKYCDDYGDFFVTTTQADIDEAKAYMRQYEKKLGNIMFIDDHIETKLADPDNKFETVPADDGYKVSSCTYDGSKIGTAGVYGDYEKYDGHTSYDVTGDYYTLSESTIQFKGTGCVGHKVYDLDGNLIWACNMKTTTIPDAILGMFPDDVVVVAAEENMGDVPCPYYRSGSSLYPVYRMQVSFPDGVQNEWWASDGIDDYLPTNAFAVLGSSGAPSSLTSSVNVVDTDGTAQTVVINGDTDCLIPQDISAASLRFTKSGDGFQALDLPFATQNATTIVGNDYVQDTDVAAGEPYVINGAADVRLSAASLQSGLHTSASSGNILSSDGSAVVKAEDVSPFVYLFDTTFEIGNLDAVNEILSAPDACENSVYDLSGRRIARVTKPGIYIVNGVKTFVK